MLISRTGKNISVQQPAIRNNDPIEITENLKSKNEIKPNYNEEMLRVDYDGINKNTNMERFRDRQLKNYERMK